MEARYCLDDHQRLCLTPTGRNRIKLATRELRQLTGMTLEEIAARTHASKSQWHNYENVEKQDLIPPHVYLPLEMQLGVAPITRAHASLNGLGVTTRDDERTRIDASTLLADLGKEFGEALASLALAVRDGRVSPNEARIFDKEFAELEAVVAHARAFAARVTAGEIA